MREKVCECGKVIPQRYGSTIQMKKCPACTFKEVTEKAKSKSGSQSKMKTSDADKWFSRFIRLRASDKNGVGRCVCCGKLNSIVKMDCGHYVKRQFMATRFSEVNCQLVCKHCNNFLQGNDARFREYLVKQYSEEQIQLIESSKRQVAKLGHSGIDEIAKIYEEKTNALLLEKGLKKWWR